MTAIEIASWTLLALAAWTAVALPVALALGAAIRRRDDQVPEGEEGS